MAEPLKEMFNRAYFERLAAAFEEVWKPFPRQRFMDEVNQGLEPLELNARMRHCVVCLRNALPDDYRQAVGIMRDAVTRTPRGYTNLLFPDFVGQYGLEDRDFSLEALRDFTRYGSSEFAIRLFIRQDVADTLAVMRRWAEDENEHVRRLASEGSRPRLPWSFRLDAVVRDPALTAPILHQLRADPSLYVRKSVANHLNDIAKDHPAFMLDLVKGWDSSDTRTAWTIKHGSRSLIKQGHTGALALFDCDPDIAVELLDFSLSPSTLRLGGKIEFAFTLRSKSAQAQNLVVDYAVHYVKQQGDLSPKVFKLKSIRLGGHESMHFQKRQTIQDFTTRKHYPGRHYVEVLVNGNSLGKLAFDLA